MIYDRFPSIATYAPSIPEPAGQQCKSTLQTFQEQLLIYSVKMLLKDLTDGMLYSARSPRSAERSKSL